MEDLSKKIASKLKSYTRDTVYVNTLPKLPMIITKYGINVDRNKLLEGLVDIDELVALYMKDRKFYKDIFVAEDYEINDGRISDLDKNYLEFRAKLKETFKYFRLMGDVNGDTYAIDSDTGRQYLDGLYTIVHDIDEANNSSNFNVFLQTLIPWWLWRRTRVVNTKKFHYDDTWYSYRFSVDYPEETFGILQIENLPFRPLTDLMNKKSFICRMDQLIFNGIVQPFMVFIDYKFVNWNCIDVVFDCDDAYLLLHGKKYNYFDLENSEVHIVVLPFKTEYVGSESDEIWEKNYEMLKSFMQDSLHMNENNKIEIEVPNMYSIYKCRGMIYNVGAWMYTQVYMNHLGLLSEYRTNKLKRMILTRITYDDAGNILTTYDTKFNALDRDSYDRATYNSICHCNLDYLKQHAMFKFDDNGLFDMENGENILANLDESMTTIVEQHSESNILLNYSEFDEDIFRENFIVFNDGLFDPKCKINSHGFNIFTIKNPIEFNLNTILFKPTIEESIIKHADNFINKKYIINMILDYIQSDNKDPDVGKMLYLMNEPLDYLYFDNLPYDENYNRAFKTIMWYNPLFFNDLIKTTIKSTTVSGEVANNSLEFALGLETRRGLKIPRYKYKDHETYVIVFLNGELIENYSEMYAAPNYFFLPIDKEFANGDSIEFLFFTYCDNNEIHFNITDNMISKLEPGDEEDPTFVKSELFKEYIKSEDIKIFAEYPEEIMIYKDLIDKREDIAFNISYRNTDNELLLFNDVVTNPSNNLTAVSSRKFIYERLYADQKAYRLKLSERFRYCDNQKQYILFINGRRMEDDSFFITVPKYSRPFWGIYLYTRRFVGPEDRVEIFYVPEELYNINTGEMPNIFGTDGYLEIEKKYLDAPYTDDFYLYFINGKKIPASDIIPIDSHTIRIKSDTKSLLRLNINPVYKVTNPAITSYLHGNKVSKYDKLVEYIRSTFGHAEMDRLFNTYVKMSDVEEDYIWRNVDRIAIINEIVRDFWVTSGYQYNEEPFVYDYYLDEIITKDRNGNMILPSLDANPSININKNDIRLLYLKTNYNDIVFEIGSTIEDLTFYWEFTNPIGHATITLVSQYINQLQIDNDAREYTYPEALSENTDFYFQFNTMQALIDKYMRVRFYNGIYYGSVDEDLLQHYNKSTHLSLDKIVAVVAKDKRVPSMAEHELENESLNVIKKDNYIIYHLDVIKDTLPEELFDFSELLAVYEDGNIYKDIIIAEDYEIYGRYLDAKSEETSEVLKILEDGNITVSDEYYNKNDLNRLMYTLNRVYQDTPSLDFETYKIGSNNYFVYACPKRLAYDENGNSIIHFSMPDINDPDVIEYGKDDHTTPVYTDGNFNKLDNTLIKLDECIMEFMDEFEYTNPSGYTETYVIWKTNGFFTRKYDDYEFKMSIKSETDFVDDEIETEFTGDGIKPNEDVPSAENTEPVKSEPTKSESVRIVNTASPSGVDVNDNIVFIDTLIW